MVDDLLDYEGDAEALGKNVGDDLAEGKPTLPLIYAMQTAPKAEADVIRRAIVDADLTKLDQVVAIVRGSGGLEYTRNKALEHATAAQNALSDFPENSYKDAMIGLTDFSIQRAY